MVAPFTGAWIEMQEAQQMQAQQAQVAPFTGAWIEIPVFGSTLSGAGSSHPSRVRGLKCFYPAFENRISHVAPFTGAWIEIRKT